MAQVSENAFVPTVAAETRVPDDYQHIEANPSQFGGLIAQGVERFGEGATAAGKFYDGVAASQATNGYQEEADKILYGDPSKQVAGPDGTLQQDTGYFGLKGQAAMDARPEVTKQLDGLQKKWMGNLYTTSSQQQFDQETRRYRFYSDREIGQHADKQQQVWATSVNETTANLALNRLASDPYNPSVKAKTIEDVRGSFIKQAQIDGTDIRGAMLKADQNIALTQIRALIPKDPEGAQRVLQANDALLSSTPAYDALSQRIKTQVQENQLGPSADSILANVQASATNNQQANTVADAIHIAESGGRSTSKTSVNGAQGGWQITPDTFKQYAKPGESIDNPKDNEAVGQRIIADYSRRYNGDPARVAVAYFSGPGNVAPAGNPTPWIKDVRDGNDTSVSAYVGNVTGHLKGQNVSEGYTNSLADYYRLHQTDIEDQARAEAERLQPGDAQFSDRLVDRVDRKIHQTIAQQDQQYMVSVHTVQQALNGSLSNGNAPTNVDDLTKISPQVADAWNSVVLNNPNVALSVEKVFDANARKKPIGFGTNFYPMLERVLAPTGDKTRIYDSTILFNSIVPNAGEESPLTTRGVDVLNGLLGERGTPEGDANAEQLRKFFETARHQLTDSNQALGVKDPHGDKAFNKWLQYAIPAMAQMKQQGISVGDMLNPKGDHYLGSTIPNYDRPFQQRMLDRMHDMGVPNPNAANTLDPNAYKNLDDMISKLGGKDAFAKNPALRAQAVTLAHQKGWIAPNPPSVPWPEAQGQ